MAVFWSQLPVPLLGTSWVLEGKWLHSSLEAYAG